MRPPSIAEVIIKLATSGDEIDAVDLTQASIQPRPAVEEKGNMFYGYGLRTHTLGSVQKAYIQVRARHPYARHILLAFHVADTLDSCDDGEYFADLTMLEEIEKSKVSDIAIFIARIPSSTQLGPARFGIFKSITQHLIQKLRDEPIQQRESEDDWHYHPHTAPASQDSSTLDDEMDT